MSPPRETSLMNHSIAKLRIVVADDEEDIRQYFRRLLPRLGYEVVGEAKTGVELAELCRAENPDLVITDIMMPDMDGIAAVAEIAQSQSIPFIIVSSHDGPTDRMNGQIVDHLVKPITKEMLQAAIDKAFPRRSDSDTST
jgi:YesN/AraC family two-component response regulator